MVRVVSRNSVKMNREKVGKVYGRRSERTAGGGKAELVLTVPAVLRPVFVAEDEAVEFTQEDELG